MDWVRTCGYVLYVNRFRFHELSFVPRRIGAVMCSPFSIHFSYALGLVLGVLLILIRVRSHMTVTVHTEIRCINTDTNATQLNVQLSRDKC